MIDSHPQAQIREFRTVIPTTMDAMIAFHEAPEALAMLTPPPLIIQVLRDDRESFAEGEIEFRLWFGPLPVRWLARHEAGPTPTSFADRMIEGPMAYWLHQHIFAEVEGGIELVDRIQLAHKTGLSGLVSRLMFDGLAMRFLFFYRHLRTKMALKGKSQ